MIKGVKDFYYQKTIYQKKLIINEPDSVFKSPVLISSVIEDKNISAKVIDIEGTIIHKWDLNWFSIWPDATHLSDKRKPKEKPGTHVHGMIILDNGDIVYNYEYLGLVRIDVCGNIVWRLPYNTHHSIVKDDNNVLWIPGQRKHKKRIAGFPNFKPPFIEPTILKVSIEGKIIEEISVLELLKENDLNGLLYLTSKSNRNTVVTGDVIHLNDVEPFPSSMEEGFFKHGDVMISLRNLNTIVLFNEKTHKVKYVYTGKFVRQHDPDFIDGNTISIYDNNNIANAKFEQQSRILIKSFANDTSYTYYTGTNENPFYNYWMGNHQWLPNGNLLINETMRGRVFEITPNGRVVWEYVNLVEEGYVGITEEAERIPVKFNKEFFAKKMKECKDVDSK